MAPSAGQTTESLSANGYCFGGEGAGHGDAAGCGAGAAAVAAAGLPVGFAAGFAAETFFLATGFFTGLGGGGAGESSTTTGLGSILFSLPVKAIGSRFSESGR